MKKALLVGLVAGVLTLAACRSGDPEGPGFGRSNRPIRLMVDNHNFLDVTVYAMGDGLSFKLGQVTGKSTGTFRLNPSQIHMVGGLQLRVEPIGSNRNYVSPVLFVDRRTTVFLEVGAELEMSYVTIR